MNINYTCIAGIASDVLKHLLLQRLNVDPAGGHSHPPAISLAARGGRAAAPVAQIKRISKGHLNIYNHLKPNEIIIVSDGCSSSKTYG